MTSAEGGFEREGMYAVGFKGRARAKAKAKEIVTIAVLQAISQESAPTSEMAIAQARDTKDNVTTAERQVILRESARKAGKGESQKGT